MTIQWHAIKCMLHLLLPGKDTRRLNWMIRKRAEVDFPGHDDGPVVVIYTKDHPLGEGAAYGKTLRRALDFAMARNP